MSTRRRIFEAEHNLFRESVVRFIRNGVAPQVDDRRESMVGRPCAGAALRRAGRPRTVLGKKGARDLLTVYARLPGAGVRLVRAR